jgi:sulfopyruvate decarboxylase TPP-binding subunit
MIHAQLVLEELKRNQATHVVGLPDNSSVKLFEHLREDSAVRLISATREGEAFAIAAGLWIGGRVPVILIQNTGFFESGDGFRGTVMRMRVPLVCLIGYRGYGKLSGDRRGAPDAEALSAARMDSAALITEPTLRAWGVPFTFLHSDADIPGISEAFRKALDCSQPVAVLVTNDMV